MGRTVVVHPLEQNGQTYHHGCGKKEIQSQGQVIGGLQGSHTKFHDPQGDDASDRNGNKYDGITAAVADHVGGAWKYEGKQKRKDSEQELIPPSDYIPGYRSGPICPALQKTRLGIDDPGPGSTGMRTNIHWPGPSPGSIRSDRWATLPEYHTD